MTYGLYVTQQSVAARAPDRQKWRPRRSATRNGCDRNRTIDLTEWLVSASNSLASPNNQVQATLYSAPDLGVRPKGARHARGQILILRVCDLTCDWSSVHIARNCPLPFSSRLGDVSRRQLPQQLHGLRMACANTHADMRDEQEGKR